MQFQSLRSASLLLFSDLDDSYLYKSRHNPIEETLSLKDEKKYIPTLALHRFLKENNIPLILVSGRDYSQMENLKKKFVILFPHLADIFDFDMFIGAVGTEIWIKNKNSIFQQWKDYDSYIEKTFSFDKSLLTPISKKMVESTLLAYPKSQFRLQNIHDQQFKISFEFESSNSQTAQIVDFVKHFLASLIQPHFQLILSFQHERDGAATYNLDLVPCGKETAIQFIINTLPSKQNAICFTAGDSGNDISMLFNTSSIGIIVSNSKPELKKYVSSIHSHILGSNFFSFNKKTYFRGQKGIHPAQSIQQAIVEYCGKKGILLHTNHE